MHLSKLFSFAEPLLIQSEAGEFISVCFKWLCRSLNAWKRWVSRIPVLALFLQMGVLIIMAYGSEIYADGLFGVALFTAIIMIFWVVLNRSANSQESSPPMVEPSA